MLVDWLLCQLVVVGLIGVDTAGGGAAAFAPLALFALLNVVLVSLTGSTVGHRLFGLQVWQVRPGSFPLQVVVRTALLCLFVPAVLTSRDGRGFHDVCGRHAHRPRLKGRRPLGADRPTLTAVWENAVTRQTRLSLAQLLRNVGEWVVPEDPGTTTRAGADHEHHHHPADRRCGRHQGHGHGFVKITGIVIAVIGAIMFVGGASTWMLVQGSLSDERITVSEDADWFANQDVNGPLTAYSEAMVHREARPRGLRRQDLRRARP